MWLLVLMARVTPGRVRERCGPLGRFGLVRPDRRGCKGLLKFLFYLEAQLSRVGEQKGIAGKSLSWSRAGLTVPPSLWKPKYRQAGKLRQAGAVGRGEPRHLGNPP